MVTVEELMAHPSLNGFTLINSKEGLRNRVRNCKILEWETGEALDRTFHPGDFVVTTLTPYRDAPEDILNTLLQSLLEKGIAALAVKTVYFTHLPAETIRLANELKIPIFTFDDNQIDEIVYAVKNPLTPQDLNTENVKRLRTILYEDVSLARAETMAKAINPYFENSIIAGFFIPRDEKHAPEIMEEYTRNRPLVTGHLDLPDTISATQIWMNRGTGILLSDAKGPENLEQILLDNYEDFGFDLDEWAMGIGTPRDNLHEIGPCFQESMYSAATALLSGDPMRHYRDIGLMQLLCPLRLSDWTTRYYDYYMKKLIDYDETHGNNLIDTLEEFVRCGYNYQETAKALYQHPNTVRYRLKKSQEIMEIDKTVDWQIQVYVLVCLHSIYKILLRERI